MPDNKVLIEFPGLWIFGKQYIFVMVRLALSKMNFTFSFIKLRPSLIVSFASPIIDGSGFLVNYIRLDCTYLHTSGLYILTYVWIITMCAL